MIWLGRWSNSCVVDFSFWFNTILNLIPLYIHLLIPFPVHLSHPFGAVPFSHFHSPVVRSTSKNKSFDKLMSWSTYWHRTDNKWMGQTSYQISQFPINHLQILQVIWKRRMHDAATKLFDAAVAAAAVAFVWFKSNTQIAIHPCCYLIHQRHILSHLDRF